MASEGFKFVHQVFLKASSNSIYVSGPRQACDKYSITLVEDITQVQSREVISIGNLNKNLVTEGKDFFFPDRKRKDSKDRKMLQDQEAIR